MEEEKREQEWERDEEIKERAEDRRKQRETMNLFLMQMMGHQIPSRKKRTHESAQRKIDLSDSELDNI